MPKDDCSSELSSETCVEYRHRNQVPDQLLPRAEVGGANLSCKFPTTKSRFKVLLHHLDVLFHTLHLLLVLIVLKVMPRQD
jgi:hypothetical protein